jgi:hypothetical protein
MDAATSLYALLGAAVVRAGLGRYGCMGVALGSVLVGDKLYGYRGGLLARLEGVGWLLVVWVAARRAFSNTLRPPLTKASSMGYRISNREQAKAESRGKR